MHRTKLVPVLIVLAALAFGCGPRSKMPSPQPLPAGTSFAGVWYSTQFEHMYLRQSGEEVHGVYAYKYGGTLDGKTNGNLLKFTWIDPGSKEEARRSIQGKGYLALVKDGEKMKLVGEWGYNDDMTGGGPWEAEYVRPMDAEDPRTIDDLFKREAGGF